jgi:hypothetical protein
MIEESLEMLGKRVLGPNDAHRVLGQGTRRESVCHSGLYARVPTHDQQMLRLQIRAPKEGPA